MYYDGDQRDEAIVDNVVDLSSNTSAKRGRRLTSPRPSDPMDDLWSAAAGPGRRQQRSERGPPGENCAFTIDAEPAFTSPTCRSGAGIDRAGQADRGDVTDGPWCPDADVSDAL